MQLLVYISNYIVPFLILSIIVYGLSAKVNVYETFIKGAKSGFFTVVRIMPTLIGLMAPRLPTRFLVPRGTLDTAHLSGL